MCVTTTVTCAYSICSTNITARINAIEEIHIICTLKRQEWKWTSFHVLRYHSNSTVNSSGFNLSFSADVEGTRLHSDQYDIG